MEIPDLDEQNILVSADEEIEDYEFKYNFINIPWDDRTRKSKIGIVLLLVGIAVAIAAGVVGNFVIQYRYSKKSEFVGYSYTIHNFSNCQAPKGQKFDYIAKIYSVTNHELLCVGAVISDYSVLANGACIKTGRVRLQFGKSDYFCKKGFSVNNVKSIPHEGVVSKNLVLLRTFENMSRCASVIEIGLSMEPGKRAYVVGRSLIDAKSFSRQPVIVPRPFYDMPPSQRALSNVLCVQRILNCPVLVGDLLVQDSRLYGIASTSIYNKDRVAETCFADLKAVEPELSGFGIYFALF